MSESLLIALGALIVVSVLASRVADRLGVPALLAYIVLGMLVGSDVLGWIDFHDAALAQVGGALALGFILFSGGVDTPVERIRGVAVAGLLLSTVGVLLTALLVALPTMLLLGWSFAHALLLGAIVASTDAAAVFSVMRGQRIGVRPRLSALLEVESGSNDPMALFLTLGIIQWLMVDATTFGELVVSFLIQFSGGLLLGLGAGVLLARGINHARLQQQGLYPVLTIGAVLALFGLSELMGANVFLAVYLCGLVLGNSDFVHRTSITRFHDGLAWLMQVLLFLMLGLLAYPSQLPGMLVPGLVIGLLLMVVARPLVALALLRPLGWSSRESLFVGWVGLKGAVPIVLATFPLVAGVEHSEKLFPLVFVMVLLSTVVQGATVRGSARLLGVEAEEVAAEPTPFVFEPRHESEAELHDLLIRPGSPAAALRIFELGLPSDTLIVMVARGGKLMIPRGELELQAGDHVQVLAHREDLEKVRRCFCEDAPVG